MSSVKYSKAVQFIPFGFITLNLKMLNNSNQLSVRYASKGNVKGLKKCNVSNEFVSLINAILTDKSIDYDIAKLLSGDEKTKLLKLLYVSKLDDTLKFNPKRIEPTIED